MTRDLMNVIEQILDDGHLSTETLGALRAAYYAAPPAPSEWIACSERMPDEGEVVAVLTSCGQRFTAWPTHWRGASSGFAQWTFPSTDMDGVTVTHWMPLPATPKEAK